MTQTSNAKIPLEVDGEVIYLDPNSAEGKALQRIQDLDPDDPNQVITIVEKEQEIDVEVIWERLKQRGYKIQIPSSNS
jgi:alpha-acetolactate decarboxylase